VTFREDKANAKAILTDKVLRGSLRVTDHEDGNGSRQSPMKSQQMMSQTVPSPPSFYQADQEKWQKKFERAVKEREEFKHKHYR
jgi:hypothetical protein